MYTFIGRLSADILVDCWPIYRSTIDRLLVDSRPIVDRYIDRLSASAHLSVNCWPIYWSTVGRSIGRLLTDSQLTVDRHMIRKLCSQIPRTNCGMWSELLWSFQERKAICSSALVFINRHSNETRCLLGGTDSCIWTWEPKPCVSV